jgi:hypothetical protein
MFNRFGGPLAISEFAPEKQFCAVRELFGKIGAFQGRICTRKLDTTVGRKVPNSEICEI